MFESTRITRRLLIVSLLFVLVLGCRSVNAATPALNKIGISIYIGKSVQLYPTSQTATNWKSSKPAVASVDQTGYVVGKSKGTTTISCRVAGKKLICTVNVRRVQTSRFVSNTYAKVWLNMLGAVETGSQVYGQRDYSEFIGPYAGSPNEYSCTAGAYQEYGENLRELLLAIQEQYPSAFAPRDTAKIASDLKRSWGDGTPYKVKAGSAKARCIQNIISCPVGVLVQDIRAIELLDEYLADIKRLGVTNLRCGMFMAECYHLGGYSAVKRVVGRATNKNSLSALRKSLYLDQKDKSNSYQIGDLVYKSRHELFYKWLKSYISSSAKF